MADAGAGAGAGNATDVPAGPPMFVMPTGSPVMELHPQSRGPTHFAVTFTLLPIASIFVFLRIYCRSVLVKSMGADDYIMILALLMTWALAAVNVFQILFGSGTPMAFQRMENFQETLKLWYSYQLQYVLTLGILKFSILAFYFRINGSKKYKLSIYLVGAVVGIYTIVMTFVNAFECEKPSDAWAITWPKKCHNLVPIYYLQAGFNIFSDIVILILPLPTLLKLQVNKAKKIALVGIFSFGSIAVIASIVRITALYTYQHSKDIPYDGIWLLTWSQIEINVAIITACAPALKPLMKRTFGSSFFGKSFYGAGYASKAQYESNASRSRKGDLRLDSVNDSKLNESEEDIMERGEGIKRTTQIEVEVTKGKPLAPGNNYSEKY